MSFFAMPSRVLFHDTMAYGSHHFLTNFKFQCQAREHLFFDQIVDFSPEGRADHEKIVFLTQQAYSRNLAPVGVGQKVGILVSSEEPTLSSVRFCFRVIRQDGAPVSCGFQTMVCLSKATGNVVAAPPSVLRGSNLMRERLQSPSFAERVLAGQLKQIFDEATLAIGVAVANATPDNAYPRFIGGTAETRTREQGASELRLENGVVFTVPGQGSYARWALREFHRDDADARTLLEGADETTRLLLGQPFLPLITVASDTEHDALVARFPDLVQIGIYLGAVLTARRLMREGLRPELVVGHSAGELAALAIAGVYDAGAGVELICHRVHALHGMGEIGGMLAVFCEVGRVEAGIEALRPSSLEVAVVNHDEQTVVSGNQGDLQRLEALLAHLGIRATRLQSPYPFHSRLLAAAVPRFADALRGFCFRPPTISVYSPIEQGLHREASDFPQLLASHFVRPFAFPDAVRRIHEMGARVFVECGPGRMLSQFVRRILANERDLEVHHPVVAGRSVVEGIRHVLTQCSAAGLCPAPLPADAAPAPASDPPSDGDGLLPIAVVSMGCILPGASTPAALWRNVLDRRSGISDAGEMVPELAAAFKSDGEVVPDKTYTLLGGFIGDLEPCPGEVPYSAEEWSRLLSGQHFLAIAAAQCLAGLAGERPRALDTEVFIGATADGVVEHDEALLAAGLEHLADGLEGTSDERRAFARVLAAAIGRSADDVGRTLPYPSHVAVAERVVGADVKKVVAVDAACASSLYAVDLGVRALRAGECDLALCGGVFAPGPANSCLFSQFRGLSPSGSRPFDASADGVVFGEGAALLALKRLPDALAAGDHVHAVIRGTGLSNDGKSPSVAVPRKEGQVLCLQRAYAQTRIGPASVQYVEAHATATPVGDAVEFMALSTLFAQHKDASPAIELGSIKALIGHTGWAAGAASLIKMTQALEAKLIPPQANYTAPNRSIDLAHSPFVISTSSRPWPPNRGSEPRRVGINGFGFGGSNAHVILEGFDPEYHCSRWRRPAPARERQPSPLVVVGFGALFPFPREAATASTPDVPSLRFDRASLHLPKGIRILPDVADHMDPSQFLAVMAAGAAMEGLVGRMLMKSQTAFWIREGFKDLQTETAVVLGVEGKTERGMTSIQRLYLDLLAHRLPALEQTSGLSSRQFARMRDQLFAAVRRIPASGPYTLPGLMPNVTAGRVSNVFNLGGANMVIDAGGSSLLESIRVAEQLLQQGECKLVLAGGVNGYAGVEAQLAASSHSRNGRDRGVGEAAFVVMLASREAAREHDFPVLAELTIGLGKEQAGAGDIVQVGANGWPYLMGAEGAIEIAAALEAADQGLGARLVAWPARPGAPGGTIRIAPREAAARAAATRPQASLAAAEVAPAEPDEEGRDRRPILCCTPELVPAAAGEARRALSLDPARVLILTTGRIWRSQQMPGAPAFSLLSPDADPAAGAERIDLSSDDAAEAGLRRLALGQYDAIVALADLSAAEELESLSEVGSGSDLLELTFAMARHVYPRLKSGELALGALCLGMTADAPLHPYTGLLAGFIKSLARELPDSVCKMVSTDEVSVDQALRQLLTEWSQGPGEAEVAYRERRRHVFRLRPLERVSSGDAAWLTPASVVLATGGARGVTAVLAEEVLHRFGCTLVLLGRTDPTELPADLRAMDAETFARHEPVYYREELARRPGARIPELKARYEQFRAAREVNDTLARLGALPGRVKYLCADVSDAAATDQAVREVVARFGRVDLVIHGAGIQVSKALPKKKLEDFRRIVRTKVGGVVNLQRACRSHLPDADVPFHLLTSAFSYIGNDGQPDYGAANEAMNRLATTMAARNGPRWTTLGWLGWAGVGMTRGSEYAALARARRLRPVAPDEGRTIFGSLLAGAPTAPVTILVSQGEIDFYGVQLAPATAAGSSRAAHGNGLARQEDAGALCWRLSLAAHPYLHDHLVNGRPTLPATFEAELAAQAACSLRPDCHVVAMENTRLERFVKVLGDEVPLRARANLVAETAEEASVAVELLSDFVHKSGRVLQKDILHFETQVRLRRDAPDLKALEVGMAGTKATRVADPYLSPGTPVRLNGFFRCLHAIDLVGDLRRARFRIEKPDQLHLIADFLTPAVLLDALFRLSMIHVAPSGDVPIYVPIRCARTYLVPGINDLRLHERGEELTLLAPRPTIAGEVISNDWAQVTDARGRVLLLVEDLVARRFGEVSLAA